jgi:flagellar hook-basal body complex protein FliE
MDRIRSPDSGNLEWVSLEGKEIWLQRERLMKKTEAVVSPDHVSLMTTSTTTAVATTITYNSASFSLWLQQQLLSVNIDQDNIASLINTLVVKEGINSIDLFSSLDSSEFDDAYLKSIGIQQLGCRKYLLKIQQECHGKHSSDKKIEKESADFRAADQETVDMLKDKLSKMEQQLSKLSSTSEVHKSVDVTVTSGSSSMAMKGKKSLFQSREESCDGQPQCQDRAAANRSRQQ